MIMEGMIGYLEGHSNKQNEERAHKILLDKIIENPYLIGIRSPIRPYREVELLENDSAIGHTDLVILDSLNELYLVEGKVIRNDTKYVGKIKNELNGQLEKDFNFFRGNFGLSGTRIGVYRRKGGKIRYYKIPRPIEDFFNEVFNV